MKNDKIYLIVSPMIVKNECPLSGVDDVFNAIMVTGDCLGDAMFYGRGAGKLPTASAVVADVVDSVKHKERSKKIFWENQGYSIAADKDAKAFKYFVRCTDSAETAVSVFGKCEFIDGVENGECAFITEALSGSEKEEKLQKLSGAISCIRVLD